ncbi:MAG: polyphosphate polymerase domain-containing protein [Candidatus Parvarchaeota archaeon]|nr:polyphosphate polymerase domain-containing protein [Candidatus Jingweiarchaeum tengchongense]MCW1298153.1 polyphosphate polymerase domain-containing protein [Candidatus Jingweiarchaeum tengchongense]MCW1299952.1 polyphosphate polymerase domain-containing protein [Candidatus Jingweiarchaeum tengchongense]MCW1305063.1 polyphosphate polymerase domain-containing protein [Candidatus Jingweiarchaeum tengchongense]MCW1305574.1 polyphosphate polymerase domain-containing protein [Candidatus Jingweiar
MDLIKRTEERYLIEASNSNKFLKEIESIVSPQVFPTNYNHTLYFNNNEHEVPFEISVKARRYSSSPFDGKLNLDDEWIFEIKKDQASSALRLKEKERKNLSLKKILDEVLRINGMPIQLKLQPYVADSYRRAHYVSKENEFRITIDDQIDYFFFDKEFNGIKIGNEDYARVEIKIHPDKTNSKNVQRIRETLINFEAEPVISKKDMAYNFLSKHLRDKHKYYVPNANIEIEAKLILDGADQFVFHQIKKDFESGGINGFSVLNKFPYVLETGELDHYLLNQNEFLRISTKGKSKRITRKSNVEILNDPFGLNCIVKRSEEKDSFTASILQLPLKTIYRKRKYFLVENEITKNSYCVLIDRCTHEQNELFQMEIEGLLQFPSPDDENKMIWDISYITNEIIKKYPVLKPAVLTKLNWLRNL